MLHRLEEARSEVLAAAKIFEELGAVDDLESCRRLLQDIEEESDEWIPLYLDGEPLETALLRTPIDSSWSLGYPRRQMATSRAFIQTHPSFQV